jgi:3-deoxy-D-manno-octulosonate 8-phosphate phosphatase (KDO 8-P phosphatase)
MNITQAAARFSGTFITSPGELAVRLERCRAFVFDWDGVFNNGQKDAAGSSPFSEVDSMGTNLLRFCTYLSAGATPVTAIISGERNPIALGLAKREHMQAVYCGFRDKKVAFDHFLAENGLKEEEVCFMFDDVLDLSLAARCGLRIMVGRPCNPLLINYAVENGMVDYLTALEGGNGAVREASELLTGISGYFEQVIAGRIAYTGVYESYLAERNAAITQLYLLKNAVVTASTEL